MRLARNSEPQLIRAIAPAMECQLEPLQTSRGKVERPDQWRVATVVYDLVIFGPLLEWSTACFELQVANASAQDLKLGKERAAKPVISLSYDWQLLMASARCSVAEVATTLPCRDTERKSHEAVGETSSDENDEIRGAYS